MCKKNSTVSNISEKTTTTTTTTTGTILRESSRGKAVTNQICYEPSPRDDDDKDSCVTESFTLEEIGQKRSQGSIWVIIHDRVYDVTEYVDRHPGGDLALRHMAGKDATDAFENYHASHVAKYLLPKYLKGRVRDPAPVASHVRDLRALRQELLRRGMFEVPMGYYYGLYTWLASLFMGSLYCTLAGTSFPVHMVGAALMGLFWQQFAGLGHDLGHTAVSKTFHGDHRVGSIIGSTLTGLSTAWWKRNHNTHHIVPNSVEDDPNIQHMPLLAVSEEVIAEPYWSTYHDRGFMLSKVGQCIVSYQHYVFLPLMSLARFNLYALGIKHLLNPNYKSDYRHTEMLCILGIFPIWYGALVSTLPDRCTMVCWILLSHAVTILLHLQIVVSHWSMETYRKDAKDGSIHASGNVSRDKDMNKSNDWYMLQFRTTMDITCPAWLDWVHIGLQFQTAHHLYPRLPRPHLRSATTMVKEVCRKHGIPFSEMGFFEMVGDSLRVLKETAVLARTGKYTRNHLAEALRAEG